MSLTAKEFAQKYAGRITKCHITKSPPIIGDTAPLTTFDARVIGWKDAVGSDPEFVALEIIPPGKTKFLVAHFKAGYHWTHKAAPGAYAKKLLVEEVEVPSDSSSASKYIPEFPHKCRDCGSPAQEFATKIDCSNPKCKHKYKTRSGMDLFLPKELRTELSKPKVNPAPAPRNDLDADGFLICGKCKGRAVKANRGVAAKVWFFGCQALHKWTITKPQKGDKVLLAGIVHVFDGKMTWVVSKP